ncbi:MAG: aldehyde dehydrogenase family protein [Candidatus Micrarchaeaceae archaeon]
MEMYIDGKWVNGSSGSTIKKFSSPNGKLLYDFKAASKDDVDNAVEAAYEAFDKWSSDTSVECSKLLYKVKELIEKDRKSLEQIIINKNGKIKKEAKEEVDTVIDQLQYYAEFAQKIKGDIVEGVDSSRKILQYLVQYDVVIAITPWNFSAAMVARKLAYALLTGNIVELIPSNDTP